MKAIRVALLLVASFAAGGGATELALRARGEVARVRASQLSPRLVAARAAPALAPRLVGFIELGDGRRLAVFEVPGTAGGARCPACEPAHGGA